ncbi:MAG: DNA-processing protein DprA [Armatimonadota bacterium]|nr:DNA-processing protein DprA [Armatimonadota bacterium]
MSLEKEELIAWIRLTRLEIAPRKAHALLNSFAGPAEIFQAQMGRLAEVQGLGDAVIGKILGSDAAAAEADLEKMAKLSVRLVPLTDDEYPANLRQIYDPPIALYVRGQLKESDRFSVAIVGSRQASEYGRVMAQRIASDLCGRGLAIVSGGARGIDSFAHRGALKTGGRTIAVLGCGQDVPYPYENKELFNQIASSGAVITEFPLGAKPEQWRFPARNRIISGLSRGVLVCEGAEDSGSLITARFAGEQGRDVYALPGGVDKESSRAPHKLIKDGAKLVETADDILQELGVVTEPGARSQLDLPLEKLNGRERAMVELLDLQPKHMDVVIRESGLAASEVIGLLTLLEMRGYVRRVPGNCYVRAI